MDKFIEDFNSAKTDIQYISLRSLTANTILDIISFNERDTKFGRAIYVKAYLNDNIVGFFLPKKFSKICTEQHIDLVNKSMSVLIYDGIGDDNSIKLRIVPSK